MSVSLLATVLSAGLGGIHDFVAGVPQTVDLGGAPQNYTMLRYVKVKATEPAFQASGCSSTDEFKYRFWQKGFRSFGMRNGSFAVGSGTSGEGRVWDIALGQNMTYSAAELELTVPCNISLELSPQWYTLELGETMQWTSAKRRATGTGQSFRFRLANFRWLASVKAVVTYDCVGKPGEVVSRMTFSEPSDVPPSEYAQICHGCSGYGHDLTAVKYLEATEATVAFTYETFFPKECNVTSWAEVTGQKATIEGPYVAPAPETPSPTGAGHGLVPCVALLVAALLVLVA